MPGPAPRKILTTTALAAVLLVQALGSLAASSLGQRIAAGKWDLAYQRTGVFKPLLYKHAESGSSSTCIAGDPRQHILDWVQGKGCRVDRERLLADRYVLSGECRLKWMKGHPVAVDVDLIFGDRDAFVMDIHTRQDPLLSFQERTRASYAGPCSDP